MEDKDYLNGLFNRYLNNECSKEEIEVLLHHFGSEAGENTLRELVREQLEMAVYNYDELPADAHDVLKQSYKNIANETYLKKKEGEKIVFFDRNTFIKLSACASILLLAGAFFFGKQYLQKKNYRQAITLKGERKQLQLADGTKIWLAPGSTLNYPDNFSSKTREVTLSGEAFFEVAHDMRHPFIIHTGKLNTTVLGTTFNIQAYPERSVIEVALLSGKVGVAETGKPTLVLTPDQKAVFNKTNESLNKEDYPAGDMLARRNGKFIYKGVLLSNVISDISEVFNATIVLDKEIQNVSYYGEFDQKEGLQSVLMEISLSANVKLENKVTIWQLHK